MGEDLQIIVPVTGAMSVGAAKAGTMTSGIWRPMPYPKPTNIWYPTHFPVDVPISSVYNRLAEMVTTTELAMRIEVAIPVFDMVLPQPNGAMLEKPMREMLHTLELIALRLSTLWE